MSTIRVQKIKRNKTKHKKKIKTKQTNKKKTNKKTQETKHKTLKKIVSFRSNGAYQQNNMHQYSWLKILIHCFKL